MNYLLSEQIHVDELYFGEKKLQGEIELRNNFGVQIYPNNSIFIGHWVDNEPKTPAVFVVPGWAHFHFQESQFKLEAFYNIGNKFLLELKGELCQGGLLKQMEIRFESLILSKCVFEQGHLKSCVFNDQTLSLDSLNQNQEIAGRIKVLGNSQIIKFENESSVFFLMGTPFYFMKKDKKASQSSGEVFLDQITQRKIASRIFCESKIDRFGIRQISSGNLLTRLIDICRVEIKKSENNNNFVDIKLSQLLEPLYLPKDSVYNQFLWQNSGLKMHLAANFEQIMNFKGKSKNKGQSLAIIVSEFTSNFFPAQKNFFKHIDQVIVACIYRLATQKQVVVINFKENPLKREIFLNPILSQMAEFQDFNYFLQPNSKQRSMINQDEPIHYGLGDSFNELEEEREKIPLQSSNFQISLKINHPLKRQKIQQTEDEASDIKEIPLKTSSLGKDSSELSKLGHNRRNIIPSTEKAPMKESTVLPTVQNILINTSLQDDFFLNGDQANDSIVLYHQCFLKPKKEKQREFPIFPDSFEKSKISKFIGKKVNDSPSGYCSYVYSDGNQVRGFFKDGKKEGTFYQIKKDHIIKQEFKNDVLTSDKMLVFASNGQQEMTLKEYHEEFSRSFFIGQQKIKILKQKGSMRYCEAILAPDMKIRFIQDTELNKIKPEIRVYKGSLKHDGRICFIGQDNQKGRIFWENLQSSHVFDFNQKKAFPN